MLGTEDQVNGAPVCAGWKGHIQGGLSVSAGRTLSPWDSEFNLQDGTQWIFH